MKDKRKALTPAQIAERDAARGYTDADEAEVLDHPELTDEELATARPFAEVFPALAASIRASREGAATPSEEYVSLLLERIVVDHYRRTGSGWQQRVNDILKKAAGL